LLVALELADQHLEVLGLAEVLVDRGEPDIGDLIQARQRLHDELADHRGRDLVLAEALEAADDPGDRAIDALALHRPLAQRLVHRTLQLSAPERPAPPVLLDHPQLAQLDALEGREPPAALRAMAPPPDRRVVLARAAVLHLGVVVSAKRAAHGVSPWLRI